jgi:arylsulfatase
MRRTKRFSITCAAFAALFIQASVSRVHAQMPAPELPEQAVPALGQLAEQVPLRVPDSGRLALHAVGGSGGDLPYDSVRVGDELRVTLAPSGRTRLAVRPAQVDAGGRLFVYADIPPDAGKEAFDAEILLWEEGGWRRRQLVHKEAGKVGKISATLVVPDLEVGPVATAVFRRDAVAGARQVVSTRPVVVPRGARLRVGFALDEWDQRGLGPITVSVAAVVLENGQPTGREYDLLKHRLTPAVKPPRWDDDDIDLSKLAGETVRFEFRSLAHEGRGILPPHVAWSMPTLVTAATAAVPPSIVLVSLDSVRAQSLGCCGSDRATSPFMDRLFGSEGVIFDHAVTTAVDTIAAHMSLLTGLHASVHGVLSTDRALGSEVPTLAQSLAANGYATAAFTDGAGLVAELGFGRGFDVYYQDSNASPWDVEGRASITFAGAVDFIQRHRGEPFFVFVHTRQARAPHVPPRGYLDYFKDERLERTGGVDQGLLVRYLREIRYLDDVVKEFVGRLDAASPPSRTLLVVTSGHGEEFLEHGALEHGTQLYEESIRVPLMMRGAGVRAGVRYGETIGLVDVAPTITELAAVDEPPAMQGRSIAKSLRSGLPYALPPRFTEAHGVHRLTADGEAEGWKPPAFAISDSGHKVIMHASGGSMSYEAYDLIADPGETTDLFAAGAATPPWVSNLKDVVESYPVACKRVARETSPVTYIPFRTRLQLEALGYVQ